MTADDLRTDRIHGCTRCGAVRPHHLSVEWRRKGPRRIRGQAMVCGDVLESEEPMTTDDDITIRTPDGPKLLAWFENSAADPDHPTPHHVLPLCAEIRRLYRVVEAARQHLSPHDPERPCAVLGVPPNQHLAECWRCIAERDMAEAEGAK